MPDARPAVAAPSLTVRIRRVPLGILLLATVFAILGVGSMTGGVYLMIAGGTLTLWAATVAIVIGPAILYLAYHLLHLTPWTWLALILLTGLLFLSSILRIGLSPGIPLAAVAEVVAEVAVVLYLLQPRVRARYEW